MCACSEDSVWANPVVYYFLLLLVLLLSGDAKAFLTDLNAVEDFSCEEN